MWYKYFMKNVNIDDEGIMNMVCISELKVILSTNYEKIQFVASLYIFHLVTKYMIQLLFKLPIELYHSIIYTCLSFFTFLRKYELRSLSSYSVNELNIVVDCFLFLSKQYIFIKTKPWSTCSFTITIANLHQQKY